MADDLIAICLRNGRAEAGQKEARAALAQFIAALVALLYHATRPRKSLEE